MSANVAPRAGAWIETDAGVAEISQWIVAPRAGAWIETRSAVGSSRAGWVAPRAGAWIETGLQPIDWGVVGCRPPRGGVD